MRHRIILIFIFEIIFNFWFSKVYSTVAVLLANGNLENDAALLLKAITYACATA